MALVVPYVVPGVSLVESVATSEGARPPKAAMLLENTRRGREPRARQASSTARPPSKLTLSAASKSTSHSALTIEARWKTEISS